MRIKRMKLFDCESTGGGGTKDDRGIWEIKKTPKTIRFTLKVKPFFDLNFEKIIINKFYNKRDEKDSMGKVKAGDLARKNIDTGVVKYRSYTNNGHCLRDWLDGTYTLYPFQGGTPYFFKPKDEN